MPKITIDDIEIDVEEGLNIIQAATRIGVEIPHFCYHPSLSIVAQCRQCLVEVEGVPKVLPACNTFVRDGLVVKTNTEKALKAREATVEFTLINHPLDCPICDKGGECPLQLTTFNHGPGYSRFDPPEEKKVRQKYYLSEKIVYDPNRCIMCTRCIRFTDEVTKTFELGTDNRGFRKKIVVFPGKELENELAGNVVDICPVGALLTKDNLHQERVWYWEFTDSVCTLCSNGCNITVGVDPRKGKVSRVRPRTNTDVNQYWICDKGRYGFKEVQEEDRLRDPIKKNGKGHEITTWNDATNIFYEKVSALQSSGKKVAFLISPKLTNEELFLIIKLFEDIDADLIASNVPSTNGEKKFNIISSDPYPNSYGIKIFDISSNTNDIIENLLNNNIDCLFVAGLDLFDIVRTEDHSKLKNSLSKLELLAVVETKLNKTMHQADLIFPGVTPYEKDGTYTNDQGRVQKVRAAIPPPGSSKNDWEILCLLGSKFNPSGFSYEKPEEIMQDISKKFIQFNGINYDKIGMLGYKILENG